MSESFTAYAVAPLSDYAGYEDFKPFYPLSESVNEPMPRYPFLFHHDHDLLQACRRLTQSDIGPHGPFKFVVIQDHPIEVQFRRPAPRHFPVEPMVKTICLPKPFAGLALWLSIVYKDTLGTNHRVGSAGVDHDTLHPLYSVPRDVYIKARRVASYLDQAFAALADAPPIRSSGLVSIAGEETELYSLTIAMKWLRTVQNRLMGVSNDQWFFGPAPEQVNNLHLLPVRSSAQNYFGPSKMRDL